MPIRFIKKMNDGSTLALWYIDEEEDELKAGLRMSDVESKELSKIRSPYGRIRWLAVRRALNSLFPQDIAECLKDEHGKPFVKGFNGYISLSHSNEYAVAIAHPSNPVGVDIEIVQPKIMRIKQKFLTDKELLFIQGENQIEQLYACWCAKESIFKWQGRKGISLKQNIDIVPFEYREKGNLQAYLNTSAGSQLLAVEYEKMEGYFLAYVSNP